MDKEVIVEVVRIVPSILWIALTGAIIYIFRNILKTDLLPRVSNFKALGVEATFVKKELDRVAIGLDAEIAGTDENRSQVARRAERIKPLLKGSKVLLINDIPSQMNYVVNILNELNVEVDVAISTEEAINNLCKFSFNLVISDMCRGDKVDAGVDFLKKSKALNIDKPTIFTVGKFEPERGVPPYAFGITNRIDELMNLIFDVIERQKG